MNREGIVDTRGASARLPVVVFLALSAIAAAVEVTLFAPFAVADEHVHFFRAAAIAEGRFLPERRAEGTGSELPESLAALPVRFPGAFPERVRAALPAPAPGEVDFRALREALREPLHPERTVFVDYRGAASYTPVPYLAAAAGIALARAADASALGLFYAGRVANGLACAGLVAWAIGLLPFGRWTAVAIALVPMATTSRTSLSADAATTALAWLLVAALLRIGWRGRPGSGVRGVALAAAALSGLCKPWVYLPLLAPVLALTAERARRRALLLPLLAVALAANALGFLPSASFGSEGEPFRAAWLGRLAEEPLLAPRLIAADLARRMPAYVAQACGLALGWKDVLLPRAWVALTLAVVAGVALIDGVRGGAVPWRARAACLAGLLAVAVLVAFAQLLHWTPPGAPHGLEGVQGRYLLPAAWLVLPVVQHAREGGERARLLLVVGWRLFTAILVAAGALDRYWR